MKKDINKKNSIQTKSGVMDAQQSKKLVLLVQLLNSIKFLNQSLIYICTKNYYKVIKN